MNSTQGNLVIVGANTDAPQVFFYGVQVDGVLSIVVDTRQAVQKVVLKIAEDQVVADLQAAGVIIRRALS